ncbi:hypothetical protein HDU83_009234 [Entophlyctis luteolus]|nr:hypothetical protein HDU83_009234 [Entophlyctis luteolus]
MPDVERVDSGIGLETPSKHHEDAFLNLVAAACETAGGSSSSSSSSIAITEGVCDLAVAARLCDETQAFLAVSHVWGSAHDDEDWTDPLLPAAFSVHARVHVLDKWTNSIPSSRHKNNLAKLSFLRTLLEHSSESVWLDWKDNNQHDPSCMHAQVRHLPTVYREAAVVVIIHTCGALRRALKKSLAATSPEVIAKIFVDEMDKSRYRSRVCTLQEEAFARTKCHVIVDHVGSPVFLSRRSFFDVIASSEGLAGWQDSQEFLDMLDMMFGNQTGQSMPPSGALNLFLKSDALAKRFSSVAKDLYFAIAIPCGIDLGLDYTMSAREVLLVWAKYLLENDLLTTCWRGYASRYHDFSVSESLTSLSLNG